MRFADRLRDESGMTLVELLAAAFICAVGIAATIGVLGTSREVSVKAEKRDTMAHHGEREMERLLELPWVNFAHTTGAAPNASPWPGTPSGANFSYDRNDTAKTEELVTSATGQVSGAYTTWNDNQSRLSGRLYRFVTRIDGNSRRVTVVVTADGAKPPQPLLLSSIKTQPLT